MSDDTIEPFGLPAVGRLSAGAALRGRAASVKSFGRHLAYESLRGTNPRAADDGLWVFLFSAEPGEVTAGSGKRGT
jgi:hypothetical protein